MSAHDLDADQQHLGRKIRSVLWRFDGRGFDDGLLAEMADVLHDEFKPWLGGRRIKLLREEYGVRVEVSSEPNIDAGPHRDKLPSANATSEKAEEIPTREAPHIRDVHLAGFQAVDAALAA